MSPRRKRAAHWLRFWEGVSAREAIQAVLIIGSIFGFYKAGDVKTQNVADQSQAAATLAVFNNEETSHLRASLDSLRTRVRALERAAARQPVQATAGAAIRDEHTDQPPPKGAIRSFWDGIVKAFTTRR